VFWHTSRKALYFYIFEMLKTHLILFLIVKGKPILLISKSKYLILSLILNVKTKSLNIKLIEQASVRNKIQHKSDFILK
jgi:hypothetical protein